MQLAGRSGPGRICGKQTSDWSTEEVVGTVRAKIRATLEAKSAAASRRCPFIWGKPSRTGDLVARLDAAEIKARLEQAQASLEQAERDWNRISSLFKGQAVTRSEYDQAESRQRLAKAAVAEAEAMMRYAEVLAPFDGVVSRKWADVGDFASPGKPLVEIEDPSSLQLEADVPESMAGHIQLGTPCRCAWTVERAQFKAKSPKLRHPPIPPAARFESKWPWPKRQD